MSYRRLTGLLLLWAVLPMPFLYVFLPPFWLMAAAAGVAAMWRPAGSVRLSPLVLNVLAVVIVVVVVATGGWRVGPVRPLGHMLLLLTTVRSLSVEDRASFLRCLPPVFLVWLMSVATSTHVTLMVYLALSAVVWWWAGMTFLLMGLDRDRTWRAAELPRWRHAVAAALVAAFVAVPIFVAMPRLRSPWVAGQQMRRTSGFAPRVELGRSGTIEESRELAVTIDAVDDERMAADWTRLRGTAFNMVFAGSWVPRRQAAGAPERRNGLVWLSRDHDTVEGAVQLELEVMRPRGYLFVPQGTVALRAPVPVLVDDVGGVLIPEDTPGPFTYNVWVERSPTRRLDRPQRRDTYLPKRNGEVRRLAFSVAGGAGDAEARARAVEDHLKTSYAYSLETSGVVRTDPVAWFLLSGRQGHCEFFAGGMVVLLRHLGVPARLVAGYNGGAAAPSGRTVLVRQANAHTWVEAWLGPQRGWVAFDPTPEEGVPQLEGQTGLERLMWAWDRVQDSWDRYILTFGLGEQVGLLSAAAEVVAWVAARLRWQVLAGLVLIAGAFWGLIRVRWVDFDRLRIGRSHRRPPAARAVERLARRLRSDGVEVPQRATVRWIGDTAALRWPGAASELTELVWLAEHELYADTGQPATRAGSVRRLWRRARQGMVRNKSDATDARR